MKNKKTISNSPIGCDVTNSVDSDVFFPTPSTLVLLSAPYVPIKTVQWSRSSAALAGSVHRLSGPSMVLILGQVRGVVNVCLAEWA